MASPLMSPPHNGTPFIYFTERLSLVSSTALKSYYLYVNDEWIECCCQEQYLFVSFGHLWLCFNSISPPPLSVIDNWCGRTSLSEDVKFFKWNRRVPRHCSLLEVYFAVFSSSSFAATDDDLTLMWSWGRCGSWKENFRNNEAASVV